MKIVRGILLTILVLGLIGLLMLGGCVATIATM